MNYNTIFVSALGGNGQCRDATRQHQRNDKQANSLPRLLTVVA